MDLAALVVLRHRVPDGVLLDCLDLEQWLAPLMNRPEPPRISTEQLMARWFCSQPAVSRRIGALRRYGLANIKSQGGRGAQWVVRRIGPAASLPTPKPCFDNDPTLDVDNDKRTVMHLITAKLERRLAYWRQQQEREILKRYRAVTSI